ncbi:MAG TPA: UDP-3-O-acyl-N-acetylglucosamine deacetylase [Rhizomicrobium sp.]|jgi:UDP-3-O-[3-hydroxymyristoyl] N-acetylglucosamine deacetylase|nr:UDP-3-O-acyl-N-acetylglucosamine deacetylase [Rhizomicrobium sp.]
MTFRHTLAGPVTACGTALHAGVTVNMTLLPAPAGQGVVFVRTDLGGKQIPARYDLVSETRLGTVLEQDGVRVGVVEHLMAAVAGAGLDDLTVSLDGPEPPILDGDALSYLALIHKAGIKSQNVARHAFEILKPVRVSHRDSRASLSPGAGTYYEFEIEFSAAAIGRQTFALDFSAANFAQSIAPARTFGFLKELEALHAVDMAKGASLENTLALDEHGLVNPGLMRFPDEFVRHKILDAIGDMALAGAPLLGRFQGVRSGHATNNALLRALFADSSAFRRVPFPGTAKAVL